MKKKSLLFGFGSLLFAGAASAVAPLVIAGIVGAVAIAGFSIYRSAVPVDMNSALTFFSSCWSCQIFSDIVATISSILPPVYEKIGEVCIPVAVALTAVWFAWKLLAGYIGQGKIESAWGISGQFGSHLIKLTFIIALLAWPLPRFLTSAFIEPVFNIGMSIGHAVNDEFQKDTANEKSFETCLISTAVADPAARSAETAEQGLFSPKLRHELTCNLATVHQMTGMGMATGWTMLNMSFSADYMHKILGIPVFPNIITFFAGLLVVALFFFALIPVPMYLLEVVIELALDLVMLPLWLLGWLFDGWKIMPDGIGNIKKTLNRVIKDTAGIATVLVFVAFGVFLLSAVSGTFGADSSLHAAFANNDPKILMDGIMLENDSLVVIVLIGLFFAMFMGMIPKLVNSLFSTVHIPDEYYKKARENIEKAYESIKKNGKNWKGILSDLFGLGGGAAAGGSGGGGAGGSSGAGGGGTYNSSNPGNLLPTIAGVYQTKAFDGTHFKPKTVSHAASLGGAESNAAVLGTNAAANNAGARRIFWYTKHYESAGFASSKNAIENSLLTLRNVYGNKFKKIIFAIYSKDSAGAPKADLTAEDIEILDLVHSLHKDYHLVIDGADQISAAELAVLHAAAEAVAQSAAYNSYAHSTVLTMDSRTGTRVGDVISEIRAV